MLAKKIAPVGLNAPATLAILALAAKSANAPMALVTMAQKALAASVQPMAFGAAKSAIFVTAMAQIALPMTQ